MLIYATRADYADWLSVDPETLTDPKIDLRLRYASAMMRRASVASRYRHDKDTGLPTDTHVIQAFRDATCAQAEAWTAQGLDPAEGVTQIRGQLVRKQMNGSEMQWANDTKGLVFDEQLKALSTLAPLAAQIMREAGLLSRSVRGGFLGHYINSPLGFFPEIISTGGFVDG